MSFKSKYIILFVLALFLCSCSKSKLPIDESNSENYTKTRKTNLSRALSCAGERLHTFYIKEGFIFIVKDVVDGTVRERSFVDGALSDAGRIELINSIYSMVDVFKGVVADTIPPFIVGERVPQALTIHGGVNEQMLLGYMAKLKDVTNKRRELYGMNALDTLSPIIVEAMFTRLDSEPLYRNGMGVNGGVSSEQPVTGDVNIGLSNRAKGVSLVIKISNIVTNQVIASKAFTAYSSEHDNLFKIRLGYDGGYLGYSMDNIMVQTNHGLQQALIDTAALWLVDRTYGQTKGLDFKTCLDDKTEELLK